MYLSKQEIQNLDKIKRLNLINSITGIKPANLIGSISKEGNTNLAIFSSIVHLGSNPALLGCFVRPTSEVPRHTYNNIITTGVYTINHIHSHFVEQAHYTAAKFPEEVSEFKQCQFTEEFIKGFPAPYVKESHIKIGMKFLEEIHIKLNNTRLLIGAIQHLIVPDEAINEQGIIDLASVNDVGIAGLNSYYQLNKIASFPYPRVAELPIWKK